MCTLADSLDVLGHSIQQMKKECPVIVFSSFDLRAAFYQLSVSPNRFKYLGLNLGTGDNSSFAFTSAPMGLSTSCGLLMLVMRKHLGPVLGKCGIAYAYDVLVASPLWSQRYGYHQHTNDTDRV